MDIAIVLIAPEIPQNTGAIGRLCVCLGLPLHLIEPLGFELDESRIRRAGLDYWPHLDLHVHADWDAYLASATPTRMLFLSTKTERSLYGCAFEPGDHLVFGRESSGLPPEFYERYVEQLFTIPMPGEHARSHNLSNSVSIAAYEVYRQLCT
jgi:tRNA (cytidine/uridine-2'-O-)-methyltransferase